MSNELRGADILARTLGSARERATCSRFRAIRSCRSTMPRSTPDSTLVHVRHEGAAVHMADAWGRLTGEPGIALVTGGPGHANAIGALYTAPAADSPLVLLSGHAPLGTTRHGRVSGDAPGRHRRAAGEGVLDGAERAHARERHRAGDCDSRAPAGRVRCT